MSRRTAAVAVAGAVLLGGCSLSPNSHTYPGEAAVGSDGYTVHAPFDNVQNLVPNSNVQYRDVTIGTVAAIKVQGWQARVILRLKKSVDLPTNVTLKIAQKSLLGAEYVEVDDPTDAPSGRLASNSTLALTRTGNYPETEQVLSAVSLLLNNGGLSQINTITTQLNDALGGREQDSRAIIDKLNTLFATLNTQKTNVVNALDSLNGLAKTLAAQKTTVANAIDKITPGLQALNTERTRLVRAIDAVGKFGVTATRVINLTQSSLLENLANLRPVLNQLNKAGDDLPKALNYAITIPFPATTVRNALKGDYANLFATIDLSLPTLLSSFGGVGTGAAIPTALQKNDPVKGPLQAAPGPPTAPKKTSAPTPTAGPSTPTQTPTSATPPSTAPPSPAPCPLLKKLLGGC